MNEVFVNNVNEAFEVAMEMKPVREFLDMVSLASYNEGWKRRVKASCKATMLGFVVGAGVALYLYNKAESLLDEEK